MLNPRQFAFVQEYARAGFTNGEQAAINAGYSPKSARITSARLLTNASIISALDELRAKAAEKTAVSLSRVIDKLWEVAEVNSELVPKENFEGEQVITKSGKEAWKMVDAGATNAALRTLAGCLADKGADKDATIQKLAETLQDVLKND